MIWWFIGISLFLVGLNVATIVLVLALLGGKDDRFVTWRQMSKIVDRVATVERANKSLYVYVEAVDEATGADGHKVLATRVHRHNAQA